MDIGTTPQILRDDIDSHEIDLAGGIAAIVASALDDIMRIDEAPSGLDLNSPELVAGVEDEVVALAVSPSPGDAEAKASGFGEECGFGGFAMRLARGEADGVNLDRKRLQ